MKYDALLYLEGTLRLSHIPHEFASSFDGFRVIFFDERGHVLGDITENRYTGGSDRDLMEASGFSLGSREVKSDMTFDETLAFLRDEGFSWDDMTKAAEIVFKEDADGKL